MHSLGGARVTVREEVEAAGRVGGGFDTVCVQEVPLVSVKTQIMCMKPV